MCGRRARRAEALAGKVVVKAAHLLQGAGYGIRPPQWRDELADCFPSVADDEARRCRDLLATKESPYVGFTTAANVCAAVNLLGSERLPLRYRPEVLTRKEIQQRASSLFKRFFRDEMSTGERLASHVIRPGSPSVQRRRLFCRTVPPHRTSPGTSMRRLPRSASSCRRSIAQPAR
jgi:hypothetical protein